MGGHIPQAHPLSIPNPHPSQTSLGPAGEPLGTVEHNLKTLGFALKGRLPAFGLGEESIYWLR